MISTLLIRRGKSSITTLRVPHLRQNPAYSYKRLQQSHHQNTMTTTLMHFHQHYQHQSIRPYIFFEPADRIRQAMQNLKKILMDQNSEQSANMLKGEKIMIRLKNDSREQMQAMSKLIQRNKTKFVEDLRHVMQHKYKYTKALPTTSTSRYEKGRVRFKQFKHRIKQTHLGRYYTRKKKSIAHHHHKRHQSIRHFLRSNLQKISSLQELDNFLKRRMAEYPMLSSSMRRHLPIKNKSNQSLSYNSSTKIIGKGHPSKFQHRLRLIKDWIRYSYYTVTLNEPFQREWFTKHGYPLTSRDPETDRFVNPWQSQSTNGWKRLVDVWNWKKTRLFGYDMKHSLEKKLQKRRHGNTTSTTTANQESNTNPDWMDVMSKDPCPISEQLAPPSTHDKIKMTWVGHATMLVQQSGFTVLTDPVFSVKASPVQSFEETEFLGVPRLTPPSFAIDDIPSSGVDICLISHDHYDHLDYDSVLQLNEKKLVKYWVVPLGFKDWLINEVGVNSSQIIELEWWQSICFQNNGHYYFSKENQIRQVGEISNTTLVEKYTSSNVGLGIKNMTNTTNFGDEQQSGNNLKITCAPSQHWCARSAIDRNTRLWCSWAIHSTNNHSTAIHGNHPSVPEKKDLSFYFAGDTAYPISFPLHRLIGEALGPFDLASIPIGAYSPRFFMRDSHCNPFESVRIHKDVRSKKSVAIHHDTFPLANEPRDEPILLLNEAIKEEERHGPKVDFVGIPSGNFIESP